MIPLNSATETKSCAAMRRILSLFVLLVVSLLSSGCSWCQDRNYDLSQTVTLNISATSLGVVADTGPLAWGLGVHGLGIEHEASVVDIGAFRIQEYSACSFAFIVGPGLTRSESGYAGHPYGRVGIMAGFGMGLGCAIDFVEIADALTSLFGYDLLDDDPSRQATSQEAKPPAEAQPAPSTTKAANALAQVQPGKMSELEQQANPIYGRGLALARKERWAESADAFKQALDILQVDGSANGKASIGGNYGFALMKLGKFAEALPVLQEALVHAHAAQDAIGIASLHLKLGECFVALQRFDEAKNSFLEGRQVAKAIPHAVLERECTLRLEDLEK